MASCCQYYVPAYLRWAGTFRIKTNRPELFLTFDDGPSPKATSFVLDTLQQVDAKATFFVSGKNTEQYPELFNRIKNEGHTIGNHGYTHLNGLKTDTKTYIDNINQGHKIVQSPLFRPPYGKMKIAQYFKLRKQFNIVFWTIMSRDFDTTTTWQQDFEIIKSHLAKGIIIVFHDTPKAEKKLKNLLPAIIKYGMEQNFSFQCLPESYTKPLSR